jgi:hypothetical protein
MPNTFELISAQALGSAAASVTFSSIPSTFTDLQILMSARTDAASAVGYVTVAFNGSTSNFSIRGLGGNGTSPASWTTPSNFVGEVVGNSSTAVTFSNLSMYIPNYAGSTNKSFSADSVGEQNATLAQSAFTAGLWSITTAISSITFTPNAGNFLGLSTFYLYGVKNA